MSKRAAAEVHDYLYRSSNSKFVLVAQKSSNAKFILSILFGTVLLGIICFVANFVFFKRCKNLNQPKCFNPLDKHRFSCDFPPPSDYKYDKFKCRYIRNCPDGLQAFVPNSASPITSIRVEGDKLEYKMKCGKKCPSEPCGFCEADSECTDRGCYRKPDSECKGIYLCDDSINKCVLDGKCQTNDAFSKKSFQNVGVCSNPLDHPQDQRCIDNGEIEQVGENALGHFKVCEGNQLGISQRIRQCDNILTGCADSICENGWQGILGDGKGSDCRTSEAEPCKSGNRCNFACCENAYKASTHDGTVFCCDVKSFDGTCTNTGTNAVSFKSLPPDNSAFQFINLVGPPANPDDVKILDPTKDKPLHDRLTTCQTQDQDVLSIPASILGENVDKYKVGSYWKIDTADPNEKQVIWRVSETDDETQIIAFEEDKEAFSNLFLKQLGVLDKHPELAFVDGKFNPYYAFIEFKPLKSESIARFASSSAFYEQMEESKFGTFVPHCGISFSPESDKHKLFVFDNMDAPSPYSYCSKNNIACTYTETKPLKRILRLSSDRYSSEGHVVCSDELYNSYWYPKEKSQNYFAEYDVDFHAKDNDGNSSDEPCTESQVDGILDGLKSSKLSDLKVKTINLGENRKNAKMLIDCNNSFTHYMDSETKDSVKIPWKDVNTFDNMKKISDVFQKSSDTNRSVMFPFDVVDSTCYQSEQGDWDSLVHWTEDRSGTSKDTGFGTDYVGRTVAVGGCYPESSFNEPKAMPNGEYCDGPVVYDGVLQRYVCKGD